MKEWETLSKEWETLSSVELSTLIQRLYMRLEQYEIHAASLAEGSYQREDASALVARLRRRVEHLSILLNHRLAKSMGLAEDARADVVTKNAS